MRPLILALSLCLGMVPAHAQEKTLLKSSGWATLSGKVTKEGEKKGVADVAVFLKPPQEKYFPIHDDDKVRKEPVVVELTANGFSPRLSACYSFYFDGTKRVRTLQALVVKNRRMDFTVVRLVSSAKDFKASSTNIAEKGQAIFFLDSQRLPIILTDFRNPKAAAHVYAFDHPYFAITDKDGRFSMPRVPVSSDLRIVGWNEDGWVMKEEGELKNGRAITLKDGKNTFDFEIKRSKY